MNFKSDNVTPISPEIMKTLMAENHGFQSSYGADELSSKLQERFSEIFEKKVLVYLTNTGTAANSLALSALVSPYDIIFCSHEAHIYTDECGAPELYTGGAKLLPLETNNGKITLKNFKEKLEFLRNLKPHGQRPGCVSITQSTECGTVYTLEELQEISKACKEQGLPLHMDGARFANSLVTLNCTPSEITWKAGIDVMSFGATKNGALCAEAILFFNPHYAENFDYLHKRAGQLMSKSRFFAAQFLAYFENNLWLKNARHANMMAQNLKMVFSKYEFELVYPVEANEIFVKLPPRCAVYLRSKNISFYEWGLPGSNLCRFVTSWITSNSDIEVVDESLAQY